METRDLDMIGEYCSEAQRLAEKRGDKLLSYFIGMALIAARDAKRRRRHDAGRKPSSRRRR